MKRKNNHPNERNQLSAAMPRYGRHWLDHVFGAVLFLWILSEIGLLTGLIEYPDIVDASFRGFAMRLGGWLIFIMLLCLTMKRNNNRAKEQNLLYAAMLRYGRHWRDHVFGAVFILWILSEIGLLMGLIEYPDIANASLRGFAIRVGGFLILIMILGLPYLACIAVELVGRSLISLYKHLGFRRDSDD